MTRFSYVMVAYCATMATVIPAFVRPAPRLVWNASASVPIGFYTVRQITKPKLGDLVAIVPPTQLARFLATRHYLPRGVPLLKRVAGSSGQRVCREGLRILVDGRHLGDARSRDTHGRALPSWRGCHTLTDRDVFLMNADVPDSFDGRYFGPLPTAAIIGTLTPMWIKSGANHAAPPPQKKS